jgi:hypothetical protein
MTKLQNKCDSFNYKLFVDHELFSYLVKISLSQSSSGEKNKFSHDLPDSIGVLSTDEVKLFARAFAAMMPDTLIRIPLRVIDAAPERQPKIGENVRPEKKLSKKSLL